MAASFPAKAIEPAGSAVIVVPQAEGELAGNVSPLASGDGVFMGQRLITGNAGEVQIVFSDDTHLVVGPGSTLLIAEYLLRGDDKASKFVVNALAGTFRFMTGKSPKNAYEIVTPTGTMGVRGTAFDFGIDGPNGETRAVLYHGGLNMCDVNKKCVLLSDACDLGVLPPGLTAAILKDTDKRKPPILDDFPYLWSQTPLREDFRVEGIGKCKPAEIVAEAAKVVPDSDPGPPPPPPPPPDGPPVIDKPRHDNNGGGNGGEGDEGDEEPNNPGHNKTKTNNGNAYGKDK